MNRNLTFLKRGLLAATMMVCCTHVDAQLSGTYTINASQTTGGSNYQSFTDFANAINTSGVNGPVVVDVVPASGPYTERAIFGNIPGAGPGKTIRINGNGNQLQFSNTAAARQLLVLNGTKYFTVDSLILKALSSNYGWGAALTGGALYDSITRCTVDLSALPTASTANNNQGIAITANLNGAPTGSATNTFNASHCYIGGNYIKGFATALASPNAGIVLGGGADSNTIDNNILENIYAYGIYIKNDAGGSCTGNRITNNNFRSTALATGSANYMGIYLYRDPIAPNGSSIPGMVLTGNKIHDIYATTSFYGIDCEGNGTITNPVLIANNVIYNIQARATFNGISLQIARYVNVYHNTIDVNKANTSAINANTGIVADKNDSTSTIKNNLISITKGSAGGNKFGFFYDQSDIGTLGKVQRNNFYVNSTQGGTQYYGRVANQITSFYANQASFQAAYPGLEAGSPGVDPQFASDSTGNLTPTNPALSGTGENLAAAVPVDINGLARPANPTPGAFEMNSTPLGITLSALQGQVLSNGTAALHWSCMNGSQNPGFDIEHSYNGKDWDVSGFMAAKATSRQDYYFNDNIIIRGNIFYRVRQRGKDNAAAVSNTILLNNSHDQDDIIALYPNPVKDVFTIALNTTTNPAAYLTDASGRRIKTLALSKGKNAIDLQGYPAGTYYLQYQTGSTMVNRKFIKQ